MALNQKLRETIDGLLDAIQEDIMEYEKEDRVKALSGSVANLASVSEMEIFTDGKANYNKKSKKK